MKLARIATLAGLLIASGASARMGAKDACHDGIHFSGAMGSSNRSTPIAFLHSLADEDLLG